MDPSVLVNESMNNCCAITSSGNDIRRPCRYDEDDAATTDSVNINHQHHHCIASSNHCMDSEKNFNNNNYSIAGYKPASNVDVKSTMMTRKKKHQRSHSFEHGGTTTTTTKAILRDDDVGIVACTSSASHCQQQHYDDSATTNCYTIRKASTQRDIEACQRLRHEIFVKEQNIPIAVEYDGKDYDTEHVHHVMILLHNKHHHHHRHPNNNNDDTDGVQFKEELLLVACGRCVLSSDKKEVTIGRIVVKQEFRRYGLGKLVVQELEKLIRQVTLEQRPTGVRISLTPHYYLEPFYRKFGYIKCPNDSRLDNSGKRNSDPSTDLSTDDNTDDKEMGHCHDQESQEEQSSKDEEAKEELIYINEHCQLITMEKYL